MGGCKKEKVTMAVIEIGSGAVASADWSAQTPSPLARERFSDDSDRPELGWRREDDALIRTGNITTARLQDLNLEQVL